MTLSRFPVSRIRRLAAMMVSVFVFSMLSFPASAASHPAGQVKKAAPAKSKPSAHGNRQESKSKASASARTSGKTRGKVAGKTCHETIVRHGKKHRVSKPCAESRPSEPLVTNSPIRERSLEESGKPLEGSPVKARTAPVRAYAVDGETFFHNGRKYRIEGIGAEFGGGLTQQHAAHRLQQILDSGPVSLEPVGPDESGSMRAVVKVGGRNVADLINQRP